MEMKKFYPMSLLAAILMLPVGASAQDFTVDGVSYNITSESDLTCEVTEKNDGYEGDVTIPAEVSYGGKVYTVTAIGSDAFYCDELTSVTLPNTVTTLASSAFYMCMSLSKVNLGDAVEEIGSGAFMSCPIEEIKLPSTLKSIGSTAFMQSRLKSVDLPPSLENIGAMAFSGTALTSVTVPNSVTEIGMGAFGLSNSLKSAVIGNSLKTVTQTMFMNCGALEEVTLGSSVTEVGDAVFQNCTNLKTVTVLAPTPPAVASEYSFSGVPCPEAELRVPVGSLAAYQAAPVWSTFGRIVEITPSGSDNVEAAGKPQISVEGNTIIVDGAERQVSVYNMAGAEIGSADAPGRAAITVPGHGVYIVKAGNHTAKVAL